MTPAAGEAQEYVASNTKPVDLQPPDGIPSDRLFLLSTVIDGPAADACAGGTGLAQTARFKISAQVPLSLVDTSFASVVVPKNVTVGASPPPGFVVLLYGANGWVVDTFTAVPTPPRDPKVLVVTIAGTGAPWTKGAPCILQAKVFAYAPASLTARSLGNSNTASTLSAMVTGPAVERRLSASAFGVGSVAGWIAAGLSVKEIIANLRTAVTEMLSEAENAGNALLSRAANEMTVLANLAEIIFERQLDSAAKFLDEKSKEAFLKFDELLMAAEAAKQQVYEEKDALMVDLATLMGNLPFASKPVFIQSISGVTQLEGDGTYPLKIVATGLGPGSADKQAILKLSINGTAVTPDSVDSSQSNRVTLNLKNDTLRPYFKADAVGFVRLRIELELKWKGGLFNWFWRRKTVVSNLTLALFPKFAGRFEIAADEPYYEWQHLKAIDDQWTSPDCGQGKCNVVHTLSVKVPGGNVPRLGNQRLRSLVRDCVALWGPRACEWSYEQYFGINSDKTEGRFVVRHDGERVRWTITGQVDEFRRAGISTRTYKVDTFYGQNFSFDLPADNTFFRIYGQTLTRRPVDVVKGQASLFFKYVNSYPYPPDKILYVYQVVAPMWPSFTTLSVARQTTSSGNAPHIDRLDPNTVATGSTQKMLIYGASFSTGSFVLIDGKVSSSRILGERLIEVDLTTDFTGVPGNKVIKVHGGRDGSISNEVTLVVR